METTYFIYFYLANGISGGNNGFSLIQQGNNRMDEIVI